STDLSNFYSGSIRVRVQTSPAYDSNSGSMVIDPMPANNKPSGSVSQELVQQLDVMISQIEESLSPNLAQQGLDIEIVKRFREACHSSLADLIALVNDAINDRPQSIALDVDGSGQETEFIIDKVAIDTFERIVASLEFSKELSAFNNSDLSFEVI